MAKKKEIERRFLVTGIDPEVRSFPRAQIEQGYAGMHPGSMRTRVVNGTEGFFTYKEGQGEERDEDEKQVTDVEDAKFSLKGCLYRLRKTRYYRDGWEVDFFKDELRGIVLAEFEQKRDTRVPVVLSPWITSALDVTDSLTNWHLARFAYERRNSGHTGSVRDRLLLEKRMSRLVLTGGPCSGKSTAMEVLRAEVGDHVHFVPEVASIIISLVGVKPPVGDPMDMRKFQRTLYNVQRDFELISEMHARVEGKRLLVLDRAVIDSAAYLPGGLAELESITHVSHTYEYAQYDSVLCLETPPRAIYDANKANNPARSETYEQAEAVNKRLHEVWFRHPNFCPVSNGASWDDKLEQVRTAVRNLLTR